MDARKLGDGGIGVYIENLVEGLLELKAVTEPELSLTLLVPVRVDDAKAPTTGYIAACIKRWRGRVSFVFEAASKYSFDEYFQMPRRIAPLLQSHSVFHSPHYTLPYFISLPSVVTIHDVIHVTHPDSWFHKYIGGFLIRSAAKRASHIITVSEQSANALRHIVRGQTAPVSIIPNAFRQELLTGDEVKIAEFRAQRNLTDSYCLFIGTDRPHKGFGELVEGWASLRTQQDLPQLVVVGERYGAESRAYVEQLGLTSLVRFIGKIPTHELSLLYRGARAVMLPSREEGFGFVALEALGCGIPVVSTPLPSVREICGDLAWYSSDFSAQAFAEAIQRCLREIPRSAERLEAGKTRALEFSRRKTAEQTLAVYNLIAGEKHAAPREVSSLPSQFAHTG